MKNIIKNITLFLSLLGIISLSISTGAVALAETNSNSVSVEEAAAAARYYTYTYPSLPDWENTTIKDSPVIYYSVEHEPVAYEFTILDKDAKTAGFIIISAIKEWMPLLERGSGKAPSACREDVYAIVKSKNMVSADESGEYVIYYFGGLSYYARFSPEMKNGENMIHLLTGNVVPVPEKQPTLKMDPRKAQDAWANIGKSVPKDRSWVEISGVPSWYQSYDSSLWSDEGGGEDEWPDCRGDADDPWDNWDGCSAIAGAMVLGYWDSQGYSAVPDNDETVIDDCHHFMDTDDEGFTAGADIAPGIDSASQYYGYNFICSRDTSVSWSDITGQIDAGKPFVLSIAPWPGTAYGHSVTARGYNDSTDEIRYHNTLDDWSHEITFDNWNIAEMANVTASS